MDEMEQQINHWMQQVSATVDLSIEDKRKVTQVGANVAKEVIAEETRKAHYDGGRDTSKMEHLADSVVTGREERMRIDGSTSLGFDQHDVNHARIARFLNDGTVFRPGDSFYDHARILAVGPAQVAMAEKLRIIQERKFK